MFYGSLRSFGLFLDRLGSFGPFWDSKRFQRSKRCRAMSDISKDLNDLKRSKHLNDIPNCIKESASAFGYDVTGDLVYGSWAA